MKFAFDVDGVFFPYERNILPFVNNILGTSYTMVDFTDYRLHKVLKCSKRVADDLVLKFVQSPICDSLLPIDGAKETFVRLVEAGHELFIITARWNVSRHERLARYLEKYLCGLFPPENIYFTADYQTGDQPICKSELCQRLNIDCLVDDRDKYVLACAEQGIHGILFQPDDYHWSHLPDDYSPLVQVAKDWKDVDDYLFVLERTMAGV